MSSESEEEFQSADEGSDDDEDIQPVSRTIKTPPQQQQLLVTDKEEKAAAVYSDAFAPSSQQESRLLETTNKDIHHAITDSEKPSHITESQEEREHHAIPDSEKSPHIIESYENRVALPTKDEEENDGDQSISEDERDWMKNKTDKSKHDRETGDNGNKILVTDTKSETCCKALQDLKISDETNQDDASLITLSEEGEIASKETNREQVTATCDTEMTKKNEQGKAEGAEGTTDSRTEDTVKKNSDEMKSKRPRASRIGMKKPREKLGERLGTKKLGSRLEKKSLEGIGSDDIAPPPQERDSSKQDLVDKQGRRDYDSKKSNREAERMKEQQLEEERWQQVQQQDTRQQCDDESGWGGNWGGWGSSLLSAASTFTKEVGRGVGTVMETVESGLGVPDAETMAKEIVEQKKEVKKVHTADDSRTPTSENSTRNEYEEKEKDEAGQSGLGGMWLGSWMSGVSGALETAGNKVLLGGLDTLEVIGRKAMDAIQEGDPGLRKKRAFLTNNKPNLSQVLQDARLRAAEEEKGGSVCSGGGTMGVTLEAAWDRTEGGVHIEALSLVARQCVTKNSSMMATLPHFIINSLSTSNSEIKSACEVGEEGDMEGSLEGDLSQQIEAIITHTTLPLNISRISQAWSRLQEFEDTAGTAKGEVDEGELYKGVSEVVAQVAALTHKAAEMALTMPEVDPLELATSFRQLSCSVWGSVEGVTDRICGNITSSVSTPDAQVNDTITNIYLQVSHGSKYIQQSMSYLSPVLQYANTKRAAADL